MPNGEQLQDSEEQASGGDSGEWHSDEEEGEESGDPSDEEEVDSPPRREKRSKHAHDPESLHDMVAAPTGQSSKRPQTSSPVPTEKTPKQSKVAPPPAPKPLRATSSKPPKALPKIKMVIPTISG